MSTFDRIPPDHPLAQAARDVNRIAEQNGGISETLDSLGVGITPSQFVYLAEQRALRAFAVARYGYSMGSDPIQDELVARRVVSDENWLEWGPCLIAAYGDAILIGWMGRQIKEASNG